MMDVVLNLIDFSVVVVGFSFMLEIGNVVVFVFIIVIFFLYVFVLVWLRRVDKRDIEQVLFFFVLINEIFEYGCISRILYKMSSVYFQYYQNYLENVIGLEG